MQRTGEEIGHSFAIGEKALELMRAYGSSATPRAYEVWYTYVSGVMPILNDALKRLTLDHGTVSDEQVERLYEAHLSPNRFPAEAERTSAGILGEIDEVMEMIDLALGSTSRYGESLAALSHDLDGPVDRARVRQIVGSLVVATRDVASTNRTLEARLKETRGEIEQLRDTLESVRIEALTDPLTGIANRKHFEEMLVKSIDHATVSRAPLALAVIDIDHFKRFNDTYGHLTGDQVLKLVGSTMREHVKSKATIARFGGEEFAVILPDTTLDTARSIAEQIREAVMGRELVKRSTGESLGRVTISVGVATFRRGDTAVSLLERADQCMFGAKRGGRNKVFTDADEAQEFSDVA
jgi:diguanylate cyclase